ncbi:hypothetical protein AOLI_G00003670 [Acnodon oligacanthus]
MSTTFIPTNNMGNGFTIVTHVIPMQTAPAGAGQNGSESRAGFFNRLLARNTSQDHSTPRSARHTLQKILGVKSSLAANAVSAVTAGIATVLLSLDLAYGLDGLTVGYDCRYNYYCDFFMMRTNGISGVLLVFSLLQFIISICMTLFGLDATGCAEPGVQSTSQFPSCGACISFSNPCSAHSNEEGVFIISNPSMNNSLLTRPPEYSEIEPQFQP